MQKANKKSLSAQIIETLRKRILTWQYLPGHRLTEIGLCEEFKVSRSPVRDALQSLASIGLVEKKAYSGYQVVQPRIKEVQWLYDLRLALELFAVEQLAERKTPPPVVARLKKTWSELSDGSTHTDKALSKHDRDFHESLAKASGNTLLYEQLHELNDRLSGLRLIDFSSPDRLANTCREHLAILEAIESHDPERARQALKVNITQSQDAVKRALTLTALNSSD